MPHVLKTWVGYIIHYESESQQKDKPYTRSAIVNAPIQCQANRGKSSLLAGDIYFRTLVLYLFGKFRTIPRLYCSHTKSDFPHCDCVMFSFFLFYSPAAFTAPQLNLLSFFLSLHSSLFFPDSLFPLSLKVYASSWLFLKENKTHISFPLSNTLVHLLTYLHSTYKIHTITQLNLLAGWLTQQKKERSSRQQNYQPA